MKAPSGGIFGFAGNQVAVRRELLAEAAPEGGSDRRLEVDRQVAAKNQMPGSSLEVSEHIADPPLGRDAQSRVDAEVVAGSDQVGALPRRGYGRGGGGGVFAEPGAGDGFRAAIGARVSQRSSRSSSARQPAIEE